MPAEGGWRVGVLVLDLWSLDWRFVQQGDLGRRVGWGGEEVGD